MCYRKFGRLALVLHYQLQPEFPNNENKLAMVLNTVLIRFVSFWKTLTTADTTFFSLKSHIYRTNDEEDYTNSNCFNVPGRMWDFVHVK